MLLHRVLSAAAFLSVLLIVTASTSSFYETFDDESWKSRWIEATSSSSDDAPQLASFSVGVGRWFGDENKDRALRTTVDYRVYASSAQLPSVIKLSGPTRQHLVVSYAMKNEQRIECGGAFIKLFPTGTNQHLLAGHTSYVIQFGPDVCGTDTRHISLRLFPSSSSSSSSSSSVTLSRPIRFIDDHILRFYTLILRANNDYEIEIDNEPARFEDGSEAKGNLDTEWQQQQQQQQQGQQQQSENEGGSESSLSFPDIGFVGFELWQVKSGSSFDDVYVGSDAEFIRSKIAEHIRVSRSEEQHRFEAAETERLEHEAKIREEIMKLREQQDKEYAEYVASQEAAKLEVDQPQPHQQDIKFDL